MLGFDTFLVVDLGNGNFVPLIGFSWGGIIGATGVIDPSTTIVEADISWSPDDQQAITNFGDSPPPHIPFPNPHPLPIRLTFDDLSVWNMTTMNISYSSGAKLLDTFEVSDDSVPPGDFTLLVNYDLTNGFEITSISIQPN